MIETWLDWPAAGMFAVLIVLYGVTAVAILWLAYGKTLGARVRRFEGVVAPFFTSVGILFALLTGFLAGDVSERNRHAARAVQAEAVELRNIHALSVASASDMQEIRAALAGYLRSVIADDWPAMEHGVASPATGAAYDALLREVGDPRIASEAGAAVHAALINATVRLGAARSERIALSGDRTNGLKWITVLMLGVMTQVAIGLVQLQKRSAQAAALVVFSVAAVLTLGRIGLQQRPFAGDVRIAPVGLRAVLGLPDAG